MLSDTRGHNIRTLLLNLRQDRSFHPRLPPRARIGELVSCNMVLSIPSSDRKQRYHSGTQRTNFLSSSLPREGRDHQTQPPSLTPTSSSPEVLRHACKIVGMLAMVCTILEEKVRLTRYHGQYRDGRRSPATFNEMPLAADARAL